MVNCHCHKVEDCVCVSSDIFSAGYDVIASNGDSCKRILQVFHIGKYQLVITGVNGMLRSIHVDVV